MIPKVQITKGKTDSGDLMTMGITSNFFCANIKNKRKQNEDIAYRNTEQKKKLSNQGLKSTIFKEKKFKKLTKTENHLKKRYIQVTLLVMSQMNIHKSTVSG